MVNSKQGMVNSEGPGWVEHFTVQHSLLAIRYSTSTHPQGDPFLVHPLDPILKPHSIAVVGASRRPNSIGWQIIDNLLRHGFQGPVFPINPSAASVHSVRAYPNLQSVDQPIDLAVVVVPAEHVASVARDCVEARVKGMVVISAGFKEIGGAGVARERELLDVLEGSGIRLVGPNCMGVMNTHPDVRMDATSRTPNPTRYRRQPARVCRRSAVRGSFFGSSEAGASSNMNDE